MAALIIGLASPVIALIGVILGIRYTQRNWRQGQTSDRYNRALDQLSSEKGDVRSAGVLALAAVADSSKREQETALKMLIAFVRENARSEQVQVGKDVQGALQVIGLKKYRYNRADIDLRNAHLRGVEIPGADLSFADLTGANLANADLLGVNLRNARLMDINLSSANLSHANLDYANLIRAQLRYARINEAHLAGAYLTSIDMRGASLQWADASGSHMVGSSLVGANLTGADFSCADLSRADLTDARLTAAVFLDTNLTNAIFPLGVELPEGWIRDPVTGRLKRRQVR